MLQRIMFWDESCLIVLSKHATVLASQKHASPAADPFSAVAYIAALACGDC